MIGLYNDAHKMMCRIFMLITDRHCRRPSPPLTSADVEKSVIGFLVSVIHELRAVMSYGDMQRLREGPGKWVSFSGSRIPQETEAARCPHETFSPF